MCSSVSALAELLCPLGREILDLAGIDIEHDLTSSGHFLPRAGAF